MMYLSQELLKRGASENSGGELNDLDHVLSVPGAPQVF